MSHIQRTTSINVLADLPTNLPSEIFTTLLEDNPLRIERIVSHGHASPEDFWYDQDQNEWVLVLKGAAKLQFEDNIMTFNAGEFVNIPAHTKHRVAWTTVDEPTIWLAIYYGDAK